MNDRLKLEIDPYTKAMASTVILLLVQCMFHHVSDTSLGKYCRLFIDDTLTRLTVGERVTTLSRQFMFNWLMQ